MRKSDWHLLAAIAGAITSAVGWAFIIALVAALGTWCGIVIGSREIVGPIAAMKAMASFTVFWLIEPTILIAYAVTFSAYSLPLYLESRRSYVGGAVAAFLAWSIIVARIVWVATIW
jgi:hypothetical protein